MNPIFKVLVGVIISLFWLINTTTMVHTIGMIILDDYRDNEFRGLVY